MPGPVIRKLPDQGAQARGWHCRSPRGPSRAYESLVRAVPAGKDLLHLPRSQQIFVIIILLQCNDNLLSWRVIFELGNFSLLHVVDDLLLLYVDRW